MSAGRSLGLSLLGLCLVGSGAFVSVRPLPALQNGSVTRTRSLLRFRGVTISARCSLMSLCARRYEKDSSIKPVRRRPTTGVCPVHVDELSHLVPEKIDQGKCTLSRDAATVPSVALTVAAVTASALLAPEMAHAAMTDALSALSGWTATPGWGRYAFMFPVGVFVATCAQTAGIGAAAIMGPFFLLALPQLGPEYPLQSVTASVATAILAEACGFLSGLTGYFRRGLVDVKSALPFIAVSLPACYLGANLVPYADERFLKALYAVFMLGLSAYLFFEEEPALSGAGAAVDEQCEIDEDEFGEMRLICTPDGQEYNYKKPDFGASGGLSTAFGGFMVGILGVGIGEVVIPQLVKKNSVPLPVAAGTSVLVVFLNAVVAASTQVQGITSAGGIDAVPWNLLVFLVPGVVIGGQLAPRLQGKLSPRTMEVALAGVFGCVGAVFAVISGRALLDILSASNSVAF